MRVAIASRIFQPEPSAASFRLEALANAFAEAGHDTTVLTVRPPRGMQVADGRAPYRVKRFPVLRDASGYVRGYLQYLSFDIPLFFRILCGKRYDAIVVEPPPTTLWFATIATRLRRTAMVAYTPDVWSDASESTGAPGFVVNAVRWMERFAWHRARGVISVNEGVTERVREIAPRSRVSTVGNGIDTSVFSPAGEPSPQSGPYAIYTGTASEWQGADIFVRAVATLRDEGSPLRLIFLGQGTALPELRSLAQELAAPVEFHDTVPPEVAAAWLRGAVMSVASIRPDAGYDFAYPTKIFAAWGCGTPVVYAGPGPARTQLTAEPVLGVGVEYDDVAVAEAMRTLHSTPSRDTDSGNSVRQRIAAWAAAHVSLEQVAARAVTFTREVSRRKRDHGIT